MKDEVFDLGLSEEDELAMREARLLRPVVDRESAFSLIADAGAIVDAAVRRRALPSGAPFTLPGHEEHPGV
jgi:hypothetical protein